jgi:hypothetical protein
MDAEFTRKIALEHDTVMVEFAPGGKRNGTILMSARADAERQNVNK